MGDISKFPKHTSELWTTVLTFLFDISTAHSLTVYMPLLAPDDVTDGLIGVLEPVHHMDVKNVAVVSCCVHPR